ncbi:UNVERIFIED_CONTAM: hypothetical protein FKN15_001109 [Acipenser sinensis]
MRCSASEQSFRSKCCEARVVFVCVVVSGNYNEIKTKLQDENGRIITVVSPPKRRRKASHLSRRSESSEQLDKLWEAVSQQGNMLAELLHERTATPAPSVPFQSQVVVHAEWQQEDLLSVAASEEAVYQEFPSEEGDSDGATPVVHVSLSAELLSLIKRATDILNVPWPVDDERKLSIFEDDPAPSRVSPPVHPEFIF